MVPNLLLTKGSISAFSDRYLAPNTYVDYRVVYCFLIDKGEIGGNENVVL